MKEILKIILNQSAYYIVVLISFFYKLDIKKEVLVIRTDNIGDLIIFSPYLLEISGIYNSRIDLVVSEVAEELAKGLSERKYPIEKVIVINRKKFNRNFFYKIHFLLSLRKRKYQTVLLPTFSQSVIDDILFKTAQGYNKYKNILSIDENIKEIEKNVLFINSLKKSSTSVIRYPYFDTSTENKHVINNLLVENKLINKKIVIISPGAGNFFRIWPLERYSILCNYIFSKGYQPVLVGNSNEENLGEKILCGVNFSIVNLIGKTPIFVLAALLEKAILYIGSESGVLHLASAVKTPSLCLMGGGHFGRFYPYEDSPLQNIVYDTKMKCRNDNWNCAKNLKPGEPAPCIKAITVEQVQEKINEILKITL